MLKPVLRLVLIVMAFFIAPSAYAEYVEIYSICMDRGAEQIRTECQINYRRDAEAIPDSATSIQQYIQRCMDQRAAANTTLRKNCEHQASVASGYTVEGETSFNALPLDAQGGEAVSTSCVPAPGVTCPLGTSLRPRSRPPGLGGTGAAAPATGGGQQATQPNATPTAASAQSEASQDLALCGGVSNTAVSCCNNPMACLTTAERQQFASLSQTESEGGLADSCNQMRTLGNTSTTLNNRLSGICSGGRQACSSSCGSLISKYQALASRCNGCANQSIYDDALSRLSANKRTCADLQGRATALAAQAFEGTRSQTYATNCQNSTGLSPGSVPASVGGTQDSFGCSVDPTGADCRREVMAKLQPLQSKMDTAFQDSTGEVRPSFNPEPMQNVGDAMPIVGGGSGAPGVANVIANNSSGGIPGSGGGGSAKLDPRSTRGGVASGGGGSASTDIMQGDRSGGYSSPGGSGFDESESLPRARRQAGRGVAPRPSLLGMDLKEFLPGGSRDPRRHLAGLDGKSQINGRAHDIFKIISNKIVEKCRLGVLWRCD